MAEGYTVHDPPSGLPEVHCGVGATVGSVIPTKGAIRGVGAGASPADRMTCRAATIIEHRYIQPGLRSEGCESQRIATDHSSEPGDAGGAENPGDTRPVNASPAET